MVWEYKLGRRFIYPINMRIETFIITWNREDTIHLTLKYYLALGKVTLYDNFSDDRTREIAEAMGADVRLFGRAGVLDDGVYLDIKNHCWKRSNADWVIIVDDDEILWSPDLHGDLHGVRETIIKPTGFSIFSNDIPKEDWTEIMTGVPDTQYSKLCCFRPDKITDINYIYGCHEARPKGERSIHEGLYLLHYRAVGGAERLIERHRLYEPRRQRSAINVRLRLGENYKESVEHPEETRKWFSENLQKSYVLSV